MSHGPLIEIAIEPKSGADAGKLNAALAKIAAEDADFRVSTDDVSGQIIIGGISEPQLEAAINRLKDEFKIDLNIGAPQVAYRETITRPADVDYTHKKQTGGSGEFARVKMHFEPLPPGSGFAFESKVVGTVPKEYIPGVEKGIRTALKNGVLEGFPVIDIKVTLVDGAYHEVDSSALTFEIAAHEVVKQCLANGGPKLLEPVVTVRVTTPIDYVGDVIGDLNSRRGLITDDNWPDKMATNRAATIGAKVPLANMFGYASSLRAMSRGRAQFTIAFSHYEPVPRQIPPDEPFPPAVGMRT